MVLLSQGMKEYLLGLEPMQLLILRWRPYY
uniref:Uncharacterized protein n=1 Tax=Picea glauca TaxID=3330 RepID=A0A101M5F5_PICGL|nr:hypothetical protein ABT39_MTgene1175 [Picea glauca]